jgi:hypothetical protein
MLLHSHLLPELAIGSHVGIAEPAAVCVGGLHEHCKVWEQKWETAGKEDVNAAAA